MKTNHYINDNELKYEIILAQGKGKITPKLNELLYLVAQKYTPTKRYNSNALFEVSDLVNEAYIRLNKVVLTIDLRKKDTILPYITQIIKNQIYMFHNKYEKSQSANFSIDGLYNII